MNALARFCDKNQLWISWAIILIVLAGIAYFGASGRFIKGSSD